MTTSELITVLKKADPTGKKQVRLFDVGAGVEYSIEIVEPEGPHIFVALDGFVDRREFDPITGDYSHDSKEDSYDDLLRNIVE